jgi:hypothetical protein
VTIAAVTALTGFHDRQGASAVTSARGTTESGHTVLDGSPASSSLLLFSATSAWPGVSCSDPELRRHPDL